MVDVQTASQVFSELVFNPQCFLIHDNAMLSPAQWDDVREKKATVHWNVKVHIFQVSIRFSGNRASIGPVVFISHLLHCSWYSVEPVDGTNEVRIIFDVERFPDWSAFH